MGKHVLAAFDKGQIPTITVFNKAKTPLGVDEAQLLAAMQTYLDKFLVPVWGTPAKLVKSTGFKAGCWAVVFLDNADVADALAYHDLTPAGLPLSKVFVETTLGAGDLVSTSTTHELAEMMVDPACSLTCEGPDPAASYAYEPCDPVEETSFKINGIPMSNFVFPSYFEGFHKSGSTQFDQMKKIKRPFQLLAGGYQSVKRNGQWDEEFGSKAKIKRFAKEDRRGHRSELRRLRREGTAFLKSK